VNSFKQGLKTFSKPFSKPISETGINRFKIETETGKMDTGIKVKTETGKD